MATRKRRRIAPGVFEIERGVYELVVSLGAGPDGKYRQRTRRFRGDDISGSARPPHRARRDTRREPAHRHRLPGDGPQPPGATSNSFASSR